MSYFLKLFDDNLIEFEVVENLASPVIEILWINEDKKSLLPKGMKASNDSLASWIKNRSIPKNRSFVTQFLAKCGLSVNRPMDVVNICKGLSLNDSYWITESDEEEFEDYNLYDNNFSQVLAWIAFTGYGSSNKRGFASSPEFTTNGMLPKCWRRKSGKVFLYKGATSGASNLGNEPYSEMYASQIARIMGINAIEYSISKWKGNLCSVCELFTSKEVSYVPIGRIVTSGGMKAVREYYENLGEKYVDALNEMIVFDAIICNTDRHFGNFGLLIDSHTGDVIGPAPLFDHGNSLFNMAGDENWYNRENMMEYVNSLMPCVYDDYYTEAKKGLDKKTKEMLRKILTVQVTKKGKYNYDSKKLDMMSEIVRERARVLLES